MNKRIIFFVFFLVVVFGSSLNYFNQYHIEDNDLSIQSNLKDWLNRGKGTSEELNPKVLKVVQIDNTTSYIILYKLGNGYYGYAQLIKGIAGNFKIDRSGHGTGIYTSSYKTIDTNKGKYIVLYGGNPNLEIDHISAKSELGELDFTFKVSENETFVKFAKIPSDIKNPPTVVKLFFYDKYDNKIQ